MRIGWHYRVMFGVLRWMDARNLRRTSRPVYVIVMRQDSEILGKVETTNRLKAEVLSRVAQSIEKVIGPRTGTFFTIHTSLPQER